VIKKFSIKKEGAWYRITALIDIPKKSLARTLHPGQAEKGELEQARFSAALIRSGAASPSP